MDEPDPRLIQISQYVLSNQFDLATELGRSWLKAEPENGFAAYGLAISYTRLGYELEAELLFKFALGVTNYDNRVLQQYCLLYYQQENYHNLVELVTPLLEGGKAITLKIATIYIDSLQKTKKWQVARQIFTMMNLDEIPNDLREKFSCIILYAEQLREEKRQDEAIALLESYHHYFQKYPEMTYLLSQIFLDIKDYERSADHLKFFISHYPSDVILRRQLADIYHESGRYHEELEAFNQALSLDPDHTDTIIKRLDLYEKIYGTEKALEHCYSLLKDFPYAPEYYLFPLPRTNFLQGGPVVKKLLADCWVNSFPYLTDRIRFWRMLSLWEFMRNAYLTSWNLPDGLDVGAVPDVDIMPQSIMGKPYLRKLEQGRGKRVLMLYFGGIGDRLQYLRFHALYQAYDIEIIPVWFGGFEPYRRLLSGVPELCNPVIYETEADWPLIPEFDYHLTLLAAYDLFRFPRHAIPGPVAPPLDPLLIAEWKIKLGPKTKPRIGLVVSGDTQHLSDASRSAGANAFGIFGDCEAEFMVIQRDLSPDNLALIRRYGWRHIGGEVTDLADTAALLSHFDLVIGVDSGPAHLAATYGIETWLLLRNNPDWRQQNYVGDYSLLFPNQYFFRQQISGEWGEVFARAKSRLISYLQDYKFDKRERLD